MINVACYLFNAFGISTKPGRLMLLKWVNVSEKRFNEILSIITEAKNNRLKTNVDEREIILDNAESLVKDVSNGKIDKREFKKKYNNIVDNVEKILDKPMLTKSQNKIVGILLLLKEFVEGPPYRQPDSTNTLELKNEESAAQRRNQQGKDLKILTPN